MEGRKKLGYLAHNLSFQGELFLLLSVLHLSLPAVILPNEAGQGLGA